jgi:adenosylcobinamide kinase/adenosylcobinamide-phosphate guanylyltransferase
MLVVGGCRSGKSAYAQQAAERLPSPRLYVATCPIIDDEMARRIAAHQAARAGRGWETVEETTDLAGVFRRHGGYGVMLVDCITLWINNLMYAAEQDSREVTEQDIAEECRVALTAARECGATVLFVTNEVGMGIVPDNAAARRYRDLVGRANQCLAAAADSVTLLSCGLPLQLKETQP